MKIEEVIGVQIAAVRGRLEWTQDQLGARVGELLGKSWSRQTVWSAERGRRQFSAVELVALAVALQVPVDRLITPPVEVATVTMPDGTEISRTRLRATAPPGQSAERVLWDAFQRVGIGVERVGAALVAQKSAEAEGLHALADMQQALADAGAAIGDAVDTGSGEE